jgi:hypothetical protein
MSGHSTYLATAVLNWVKGTTMPAAPAAVYVALFNGDPTDAGSGGTEVTTTIRTAGRVAATFGAVSSKAIANSALVDFGNAAGTASVTHFAVFDAASAGNMLGSNALSSGSGSITSGTATNFAIGALTWGE